KDVLSLKYKGYARILLRFLSCLLITRITNISPSFNAITSEGVNNLCESTLSVLDLLSEIGCPVRDFTVMVLSSNFLDILSAVLSSAVKMYIVLPQFPSIVFQPSPYLSSNCE